LEGGLLSRGFRNLDGVIRFDLGVWIRNLRGFLIPCYLGLNSDWGQVNESWIKPFPGIWGNFCPLGGFLKGKAQILTEGIFNSLRALY